jgi:hypothetical protein
MRLASVLPDPLDSIANPGGPLAGTAPFEISGPGQGNARAATRFALTEFRALD